MSGTPGSVTGTLQRSIRLTPAARAQKLLRFVNDCGLLDCTCFGCVMIRIGRRPT